MIDELLSTTVVAETLKVHRDTVLQLCRDGHLKHTKIGPKTIRVFQSSVDALVKKGLNGYGK